ncbi:MAG: STAS domain-containing protein [Phycisphaerae bacterium]|nr:STAS domain-containing protein [Phycisphaerae bacterium]
MQPTDSPIRVWQEGEIRVIELLDRAPGDEQRIARIESEILDNTGSIDTPRVVLSLAQVRVVSSPVLKALLHVRNRIKARGGEVRLADLDRNLERVFQATKLNQVFEICPTSRDAIRSWLDQKKRA